MSCRVATAGYDKLHVYMYEYTLILYARLQPGAIVMQHSLLHNSATHLAAVHHVGMMLALAVFHGDNIPIRLAPPLLKQVSDPMCILFLSSCFNLFQFAHLC